MRILQPAQNCVDVACCAAGRQGGAVHQNDGQTQRARGAQLGFRATAPRVFGHHVGDAMRPEQIGICGFGERAARQQNLPLLGRQRYAGIDQAQQEPMFGTGQKGLQVLPSNGQKNSGWRLRQAAGCALHIGNPLPNISRLGLPSRALQSQQRRTSDGAGGDRVAAHLRCEGVCGIHDVGDAMLPNPDAQTFNATKTAHADWQWLCLGRFGAARIRKNGMDSRRGQGSGQLAGFGSASQYENTRYG